METRCRPSLGDPVSTLSYTHRMAATTRNGSPIPEHGDMENDVFARTAYIRLGTRR